LRRITLRILWGIPIVALSMLDLYLLLFISVNEEGLRRIGALHVYVIYWVLLTAVILFMLYRYITWIIEKKI